MGGLRVVMNVDLVPSEAESQPVKKAPPEAPCCPFEESRQLIHCFIFHNRWHGNKFVKQGALVALSSQISSQMSSNRIIRQHRPLPELHNFHLQPSSPECLI